MLPNENLTPANRSTSNFASGINVLLGIWLFVSPWVYGVYANRNAWNSWIVGALIVLFAAVQFNNTGGLRFLSWINCLLGIWTFFSPWIFGYTANEGRFVNSLCVGVVVFLLAISNAVRVPRTGGMIERRM